MMQNAITLFADVVALAMPYAVVFAIGQRVDTLPIFGSASDIY